MVKEDRMKRPIINMVIAGIFLAGVNISAAGDSTFEFYAKTSSETLMQFVFLLDKARNKI